MPVLNKNNTLFSSENENNSAEIEMKYSGYIEKERDLAKKLTKLDRVLIPKKINYDKIVSISAESREKLKDIKPNTLGQASRISGVSPSDISVLLIKINQ